MPLSMPMLHPLGIDPARFCVSSTRNMESGC